MATIKIDLSRLNEYEYYQEKLLYIQGEDGLMKFDYRNRFVQKKIHEEWKAIEAEGKPVLLIILKARRHGVSTYVQSQMFHRCHTLPHRQAITIAADDDGCEYIHGMSQIFYEYLPPQLQPATKHKSKDRMTFDFSKTQLQKHGGSNLGLKSTLKTVSCTDKAGLGMGNHFIHFSEYASYRDAEGVRKALMPTLFQTPGTFCIIESTANGMAGKGEAFYAEWKRAKKGKSIFKPLFYSWLDHENYRMPRVGSLAPHLQEEIAETVDDEEKELLDIHGASYEQLYWRRETIKGLSVLESEKSGLENFHEQYPTTDDEAFIVSGKNVYDRNILKKYKRGCKKPTGRYSFLSDKIVPDITGDLKVWEEPIPGEHYVIGIDPASGEPGAADFGGIEVLRVLDRIKTGCIAMQVAEWHGQEDADVLGYYAVQLGNWYNMAVLAPEVFSYGHAVLKTIINEDYPNIIKRKVMDSLNRISKDKYGWATTPTTKPFMVTTSRFIINSEMVIINSDALVDEMMIFVRDDRATGASAHGRGKDDLVMTFLIALCAVEQEYGGRAIDSIGVLPPAEDKPTKKMDALHYDDFWDRNRQHKKHWQDL